MPLIRLLELLWIVEIFNWMVEKVKVEITVIEPVMEKWHIRYGGLRQKVPAFNLHFL